MTANESLELRVLKGRAAGASRPLPLSGRVRVGSSFAADIVLREPSAPAFAAELMLEAGEPPRLRVVDGTLDLLGTPIAAGALIIWPTGVPLAIGPIVVALGAAGAAPEWRTAETLAAACPASAPQPAAEQTTPGARQLREMAGRWVGEWRLRHALPRQSLLSGGIVLASLLALALAPAPRLPRFGDPAARAASVLTEAGYPQLKIAEAAGGVMTVSGIVPDEGARAAVAETLDRAGITHELDVQTGDELLRMAVDVARLSGVAASARRIGPQAVELTTTPLAPEARAELVAAVRRDVPALGEVRIVDGLVPHDPAPPGTVSEAAKRVSTVVTGNPGYVLTADGARYFPGAILPSGHRLVAVESGAIRVERNGGETLIRF
jgi:type III secretion protein D